ncbi:MAG: AAA family ATPase [Fervidobacterium pennivorans]|uniref:AAA domain-containing protein n=2 Tax=Fervidobacterium TaxID=2422 RepID=A0A7C4RYI8_FERPE|nr:MULTISPECIES: AAA family ATPase [Fervidobacterium]AMW32036.1 AAA family ATPase [Fervidobacterium islandicum]MDM7320769.1 AAA family ATPase [Fervidobacterium sp.]
MTVDRALELRTKRAISFLPEKQRLYFEKLKGRSTSRGILLFGPRGSGKTTFLLSTAESEEMFYVSADDPLINAVPFLELAQLVLLSYNGLIVDEVHFLKDWGLQIKSLYDSFPNKKIWISDSGSIALHKSRA